MYPIEKDKEKNKEKDDDFIFPFSTCETPNKEGIAQPYSVLANPTLWLAFEMLKGVNLFSFHKL